MLNKNSKNDKKMILFRGPCDVKAISQYIKKTDHVIVESAFKGRYLDVVWDASISLFLMQDLNILVIIC